MPSPVPVLRALAARSPLRAPGAGLLAAGALLVLAGRARVDIVFTLAGSLLLAVLALLGTLSLARALLLRRRFLAALPEAPAAVRGEHGRPLPTGLRLRATALPLVRQEEIEWRRPPGRSRFPGGREELLGRDRALLDGERGDALGEDLFGLFRWRAPVSTGRRVHLLPPRPEVSPETVLHALAAGDLLPHPEGPREGDRVDSRPCAPGDPARWILWKAWARRRELLVRAPETALDPRDRSLLVCLVAGQGDGDAAGVARLLAETLLPAGRGRLGADGSPEAVEDPAAALAAISRSAAARDRAGEVLALAAEACRKGEAVLVLCPAWPLPARSRLLAVAGEGRGRLAVLAVGRPSPPGAPPGGFRRFLVRESPAGPGLDDLLAALAPLAGPGAARVALLDPARDELVPVADPGRTA